MERFKQGKWEHSQLPRDRASDEMLQELFDEVWDVLARNGYSDGRGGHEYQRVLASWNEETQAVNLMQFILDHANRGPQ